MKGIYESFGTWLDAKDKRFLIDESVFNGDDIVKHTYLKDVIEKIVSGKGEIRTGKQGEGTPVTAADYDVDKLQELLNKPNVTNKDFDACIKNKNARWTNLFKGDFSGGSGRDLSGAVTSFGSGAKMTEVQESITAVLLEINCNKVPLNIDEEAVPEKFKKKSDILKWLITSKPSVQSGICHYIDFGLKDEDFLVAMTNFLESWGKSMEKIYNANVRELISSIYKRGITAKKWYFGHFGRTDLQSIAELKPYLSADRCGVNKDDADKSDIVLFFNPAVARRIMRAAMNATSIEEHNEILNNAFFKQNLIGISLKQIGSTFNLIGVNLNNSYTNVGGDEINPDKVAAVIHRTKNTARNTFGTNMIKRVEPAKSLSGLIELEPNNKKSIHLNREVQVTFRTRGTPTISVTLGEKGAKALMGSAKQSFAKKEINGIPGLGFDIAGLEKKMGKGGDIAKKINVIMKDFLTLLKQHGGIKKFALAFADSVGYSFESDDAFVQLSAPYIKIY
jgi:hypothetical protein